MPSRRSELRASASENVLRLAIMSCSGLRVLRQHRIEAAQDVACGLGHALAGRGIGDEEGYLALGRGERRFRDAARERDHGRSRQALEVDGDRGVGAHRCAAVDGDRRLHLAWVVGIELRGPITSPTRMPLNSTADPASSPDTELSKRMR